VRFDYCARCGAQIGRVAPCVCPRCRAEYWANPKPCAGVLVTRRGRLLLVRRNLDPWRGTWDIPGGFCEAGEHPEHTATREVREETGLDVALESLLGMWMDTYGEQDPPEATLNMYFLGRLLDEQDEPRASAEATDARWFEPDDLPEDISFPHHAAEVLAAWRGRVTRLVEP
jgi:ADP-ribose pyrophosphatase YjhB (NUDIX family)